MEAVKSVSHQQVVKLLHNKFVVVLGDSIQRAVYKDLVVLLQTDKHLTASQLHSKGEMSFEQDCLVEGGCLRPLHNGTAYREVRQYQSDHHLVRFYFVTRVYSPYMKSILNDFSRGPKPDVVIINSCVWDISRYHCKWIEDYKENLHQFFDALNGVLPMESLVIWNVTMPLGEKIKGGFLVPEIEHKMPQLRSDVIEANFFSGTLADGYGLDVLDLHFQFRFSLQHRAKDGVHWNAIAHRRISWLLLQHIADAWGVVLPCPLASVENRDKQQEHKKRKNPGIARIEAPINLHYPPSNYFSSFVGDGLLPLPPLAAVLPKSRGGAASYRCEDFYSDSVSQSFLSFEEPRHRFQAQQRPLQTHYTTRSRDNAYTKWTKKSVRADPLEERQQYVMRSRQRHHYAPYSYHRPQHYNTQRDYHY